MSRKTERPTITGCKDPSAPKSLLGLFHSHGLRDHQWKYSASWNGNNKKVLPFVDTARGIPRSGWRCWHCSTFVWDESDTAYALGIAHAWGLVKIPTTPIDHGKLDT